jgi:hypothetical protein
MQALARDAAVRSLGPRDTSLLNAYCVGWLATTLQQILNADPHDRETICADLLLDITTLGV